MTKNDKPKDTVPMVAERHFKYNGRQLRAGDNFRASKEEAADLMATHHAVEKSRYNRRDMRADQ